MQNVINSVKGTALGVAEYLTPVLKHVVVLADPNLPEVLLLEANGHESKFKETGVITPEEVRVRVWGRVWYMMKSLGTHPPLLL
ncbi:Ubiquitin-like-conjugating enzyme ATG3 [Liparis tanakae]|uniref:Ubiquitin-like-conjugating enzyme ATG3 n=1 Tax=Liparis tanakae TaxID=230148 RepID=A0A4Z2EVG7_9TELE|nr:Ubiquitin-like-conjugating enzyme ATG3 [Liparis tanakae]